MLMSRKPLVVNQITSFNCIHRLNFPHTLRHYKVSDHLGPLVYQQKLGN